VPVRSDRDETLEAVFDALAHIVLERLQVVTDFGSRNGGRAHRQPLQCPNRGQTGQGIDFVPPKREWALLAASRYRASEESRIEDGTGFRQP